LYARMSIRSRTVAYALCLSKTISPNSEPTCTRRYRVDRTSGRLTAGRVDVAHDHDTRDDAGRDAFSARPPTWRRRGSAAGSVKARRRLGSSAACDLRRLAGETQEIPGNGNSLRTVAAPLSRAVSHAEGLVTPSIRRRSQKWSTNRHSQRRVCAQRAVMRRLRK
jgi:hypothetical protein